MMIQCDPGIQVNRTPASCFCGAFLWGAKGTSASGSLAGKWNASRIGDLLAANSSMGSPAERDPMIDGTLNLAGGGQDAGHGNLKFPDIVPIRLGVMGDGPFNQHQRSRRLGT